MYVNVFKYLFIGSIFFLAFFHLSSSVCNVCFNFQLNGKNVHSPAKEVITYNEDI